MRTLENFPRLLLLISGSPQLQTEVQQKLEAMGPLVKDLKRIIPGVVCDTLKTPEPLNDDAVLNRQATKSIVGLTCLRHYHFALASKGKGGKGKGFGKGYTTGFGKGGTKQE